MLLPLSVVDDCYLPHKMNADDYVDGKALRQLQSDVNVRGYLYRKSLLLMVEDRLLSRKRIFPWWPRFKMDLDLTSSSIFCRVVFLKFWLDFVLANDFWQDSHRNEAQLGANFELQYIQEVILMVMPGNPVGRDSKHVFHPRHSFSEENKSRKS